MPTCSVQALLDDAACFYTLQAGDVDALELQMLCNIYDKLVNGSTPSCDVQTLADDAVCFYNLPGGMKRVVKLQLLCNILNAL